MGSESSSFGRPPPPQLSLQGQPQQSYLRGQLVFKMSLQPGEKRRWLSTVTSNGSLESGAPSPTLLVICTEASLFSELTAPFPRTLTVGAECLKLLWMSPGHICKESGTQTGDLAGRSKRKDRFAKNPSLLASQNQTRSPPPRLP